jgi:hypothetical protein
MQDDSEIIIAFHCVFFLKTHQNNIYFLKFIFDTRTSKQFENTIFFSKTLLKHKAHHY